MPHTSFAVVPHLPSWLTAGHGSAATHRDFCPLLPKALNLRQAEIRPRALAGAFVGRYDRPFHLALVSSQTELGHRPRQTLQHRVFVTACWACAAWLQRILSARNVSGCDRRTGCAPRVGNY